MACILCTIASLSIIISIKSIIQIISNILQVFVDVGIADHVWQEKRVAIAHTIDALCDCLMRADWMAYICRTYPDGAVDRGHAIGQDPLVLDG